MAPIDPDGDGTFEQRFMLYDLDQQQVVYDSHDLLGTGSQEFEVELTNTFQDSTGSVYTHAFNTADSTIITNKLRPLIVETGSSLATEYATDIANGLVAEMALTAGLTDTIQVNLDNSSSSPSIEIELDKVGADGVQASLMERYVFLAEALESLDFKEFDYILPSEGYYIDAPNVADHTDQGDVDDKILHHEHPSATQVYDSLDFTSLSTVTSFNGSGYSPTVPVKKIKTQTDVLGWLWQTEYKQKKYYYFAKEKGWHKFTPVEETIVLKQFRSATIELKVVDDGLPNTDSFIITPGSDWAFDTLTVSSFNSTATAHTAATVTSTALAIEIGSASMGDLETFITSTGPGALNDQINTALSTTGLTYLTATGTVTASSQLAASIDSSGDVANGVALTTYGSNFF